MPIFNTLGVGGTSKFLITESGDIGGLMRKDADPSKILTANPNEDIRQNKVAITASGKVTGTAIIPSYETSTGQVVVPVDGTLEIHLALNDTYDYTELQCIVCEYDTDIDNSLLDTQKVIGDTLYTTGSKSIVSQVTKDSETKTIQLGITNNLEIPVVIRYFTYKELYNND